MINPAIEILNQRPLEERSIDGSRTTLKDLGKRGILIQKRWWDTRLTECEYALATWGYSQARNLNVQLSYGPLVSAASQTLVDERDLWWRKEAFNFLSI